ncbi:MAG: diaminopimelate decarboxylase, partial [Clostridia bacterium]|nr:diaminopimelate decarboxylase [Clostridia bacterium]
YFHGNNKTEDELELAIKNDIGCIVIDNCDEVDRIEEIAGEYGKTVKAMFRVSPGVDAHTHDFIKTGQIDSKFGEAIETGAAMKLIKYASEKKNINVAGIHCHIGSQIFELDPFCEAAEIMLDFMKEIKNETGIVISELNLGGGFGIKYTEEDDPVDYDKFIEAVSKTVKEKAKEKGLPSPFILMEPGRSIVASSGITVYKVGTVKRIENIRNYVCVDGGMGDNPRFILYGAKYDAVLVENPLGDRVETVTIAGKCCESGDVIIEDIKMPKAKKGDYLAVLATGAYNYSMASNYNRIPRPPVVMLKGGKDIVAVKRESYEDIIKNDLI